MPVRIGIIGATSAASALERRWRRAGHDLLVSRSSCPLPKISIEPDTGTPADIALHCDVVVLAVRWDEIDDALAAAGSVDRRIVIDTTNQLGPRGVVQLPASSAASYNASRAPGARWVKAFNALPPTELLNAAIDTEDPPAVFVASDDADAKDIVFPLVVDAGFAPVDAGTLDRSDVGHIEPGGELFHQLLSANDACRYIEKLRGTPPSA